MKGADAGQDLQCQEDPLLSPLSPNRVGAARAAFVGAGMVPQELKYCHARNAAESLTLIKLIFSPHTSDFSAITEILNFAFAFYSFIYLSFHFVEIKILIYFVE